MVCTPDPTQMAQEFLKLWQKQMTQAMTDPHAVKATLEAMKTFYQPPEPAHDAHARRPAPAPDASQHAIRDLTRRLERLEQSLGRLHAQLDAPEKPARKGHGPMGKAVDRNQRKPKPAVKRVAAKPKPKSKPKKK